MRALVCWYLGAMEFGLKMRCCTAHGENLPTTLFREASHSHPLVLGGAGCFPIASFDTPEEKLLYYNEGLSHYEDSPEG